MFRIVKKAIVFIALCLFIIQFQKLHATTYYLGSGGGDVTSAAMWFTVSGASSGTSPSNFTSSADVFIIDNASGTASCSGTWNVAGTLNITRTSSKVTLAPTTTPATKTLVFLNLTVGLNSQLEVSGSNITTVTVNGTLTNDGIIDLLQTANTNFNLVLGASSTVSNSGVISVVGLNPITDSRTTKTFGGTIKYAKLTGGQTIALGTYANLSLGNTSSSNSAGGALTVNGTLTILSGGTLAMASNLLTLGSSSTLDNSGTLSTTRTASWFTDNRTTGANSFDGTITLSATSGGQTIPTGITFENLKLSHSSGKTDLASSASITVTGTLTITSSSTYLQLNGGTLTVNAIAGLGAITGSTTSNIVYSGTTSSTLNMNTITAGTTNALNNLTVNSSASVIVGSTLSIVGTLTVGSNARFAKSGGSSGLTFASTSVVSNSGTISIQSQWVTDSRSTNAKVWGGTFELTNTTGGFNIPTGSTFENLYMTHQTGNHSALGPITINGTLTTTSGGTLVMGSNTMTLGSGSDIVNGGTISSTATTPFSDSRSTKTFGGTVIYASGTGSQAIGGGSYQNLTISATSGTNTAAGDISVSGTFSMTGSGTTLNMSTYTMTLGSGSTLSNSGIITTSATTPFSDLRTTKTFGGTIRYSSSTGGQIIAGGSYATLSFTNTSGTNTAGGTISVTATLTIPSSTTFDLSTHGLTCTGILTNNGSLKTSSTINPAFSTSSTTIAGTVIFAGANGQIPAKSYSNLTLNNTSGTNSLLGSTTITGTLTTNSGATLVLGSSNLTLGASSILSNNGSISTTSTTWITDSRTSGSKGFNGTIVLANLSGGATIPSGCTFSNLTFNNTSGTNTAGGPLTINGILTTTSGGTFALGTNTLTLGSSSSVNGGGTMTTSATTVFSDSRTTKTFEGTVVYGLTTGGQTVAEGNYTSLTLSNTSNTNTAGGAIAVSGTLTTTSGGTFALGSNTLTLGSSSSLTNGGTISTTASTAIVDTRTTKTFGGTVVYGLTTGAQTVAEGNYTSLTLSNSSNTNTAGGAIAVSGTLTTTSGGTFALGSNTLTLGSGSTLTNGGTISTTAAISFLDLRSSKSYGGTIVYSQLNGGQSIAEGSYATLNFTNTSGTNTAAGTITVTNALTIPSATTFDLSTYGLTCSSTLTNSGTLKTSSTVNPAFSSTTTSLDGTVEFAGTNGQIPANTYTNLNLSNSSGTNTLLGAVAINGTLTTTAGGTLALGTNTLTLGSSSVVSNSGTITTSAVTTFTDTRTTKTFGGTVVYGLITGGQTIAAGDYQNLTLSNTSSTNTASGLISVSGTLTTSTGGTFGMSSNTLTLGSSSTLTNGGTITTSAVTTFTDSRTTKTFGGTVVYGLITGGQTIAAGDYQNLTLSNTSSTNTANGLISVSGTLTTSTGGTFDMSANTLTLGSSSTLTNGGTLTTSAATAFTDSRSTKTFGGTIRYASSTGGQTIAEGNYSTLSFINTSGTNTSGGTISVTNGFTIPSLTTFDLSTFGLTCSSNLTNNGTLKTSSTINPAFSTSTSSLAGTVEFAGTNGQIPAKTYTNLTLSNSSGTNTAVGTIIVSGTVTVSVGGTLAMGSYKLTLNGTGTTLLNGGTITTSATTATSSFSDARTTKTFGGTVVYGLSTGGQTVAVGEYNNLTVSNSSGTDVVGGSIVVTGILSTTAGGTLNMGYSTMTLSSSSTLSNGGTIRTTASTTFTDSRSSKSFGGTIEYYATSGQTIAEGNYANLTLSNASGTSTAGGPLVVSGTLRTTSGGALSMATYTLTLASSSALTNGGTISTTASSPFSDSRTTKTFGGTIRYAASSGGQAVASGDYSSLLLENGGTNTAVGPITVSGTLAINSSTTMDMGTNTLTIGSSCTFTNYGIIRTAAATAFLDSRATKSYCRTVSGLAAEGTVVYSASTGGQLIEGGTYYNLTLSNSSGTNTANGLLVVGSASGTISTTAGGTLDMDVYTLDFTNISSNGTITSKASIPFIHSGIPASFGGTVIYNSLTGGQLIEQGTYNTLVLNNSSGTDSAEGAISVSGSITTTAGGTLAMGIRSITLSASGTALNNNGTIRTAAGSAFVDSRTTKTFDGTINYTSGNIATGNYNNLTLSNSTGSQSLNGNIMVAGTLTINSGAKLSLNGYAIRAVNAFSGTGVITGGSTGRIYITGSSAGTFYMDQTTSLTTNRLKYLGLASGATATLGNALAVYGDSSYSGNVDLRTGSVLTTNTNASDAARLQLKYNTTGDYHCILGLNGGSLVGEALVENYFVSGYRAYRQIGHVLDSALSLNQITDDFDLFGSISSGSSGRGTNVDGLYAATSTAKNSVFTYKEDVASGSKWIPFTTGSSNSTIATGSGIMFFMRSAGSGESGNYNDQFFDYEGAINQRRRAVSVLKGSGTGTFGYNLVSNPYAAYLNFDNFIDTNNSILADKGFYKYDKSTKNYTTHAKSGGQWYKNSNTFSLNNAYVDPGDAFWVRATSAGTIYFNPTMTAFVKSSDVSKGNRLEMDTTLYSILGLKMKSQSDSTIGDEVSILSASWGGDMRYKLGDMSNMKGTCIDLAVVSSDKESVAFKTLDITKSWLIPLDVQSCTIGSYSFDFYINSNKTGYEADYQLLDRYLNKTTKITSGNKLVFQITSDTASKGNNRFFINAIPSEVLSTQLTQVENLATIFPNPLSTTDNLKINVSRGNGLNVELINVMGQQLYRAENVSAGKVLEVDMMSLHLVPGIYYLKVVGHNENHMQRVIIN